MLLAKWRKQICGVILGMDTNPLGKTSKGYHKIYDTLSKEKYTHTHTHTHIYMVISVLFLLFAIIIGSHFMKDT